MQLLFKRFDDGARRAFQRIGQRAFAGRGFSLEGGHEVLVRSRNDIVYFYPKDDTPGCTKEAQGFRDLWKQIEQDFERDRYMDAVEAMKYGLVDEVLGDTSDIVMVKEGDIVKVKVLEVDKQGRVRLSMKEVGKDD